MSLDVPRDWVVGTALPYLDGRYVATDFDHLVDSPLLMGSLSKADTVVAGAEIRVFCYSAEGKVTASDLLSSMHSMLAGTQEFLGSLPVEEYTFLFHFEPEAPNPQGAWEHQLSSEYVFSEEEPTPEFLLGMRDVAAHEFFHIVTPLNLHSEKVETFNFVNPDPSLHLWLYEGVTEWATQAIQVRSGLYDFDEYLAMLTQQYQTGHFYFDPDWSLKRLALESYSAEGQIQYGNIYYKGALIIALLDVRLLELSGGKRGLREVLLDLIGEYGVGNPFSEDTFLDDFVASTYPEVGDFFEKYVMDAAPLPMVEYFNKVGVDLVGGESDDAMPYLTPMEGIDVDQAALQAAWLKNHFVEKE